jgi:A nuclease family of the HNH/ENDO VII superfamily with conserved AHH
MKKNFLRLTIASFVFSTSFSMMVQPSLAAYPPSCGAALSATDKSTARDKLRTSLGPHTYPKELSPQAHHLIPLDLFTTAEGIKICNYGINLLDSSDNGVWLPNRNCSNKPNYPYLHRGSHPVYTTYVQGRLGVISSKAQALQLLAEIKKTLTTGVKVDANFPASLNNAEPDLGKVSCS